VIFRELKTHTFKFATLCDPRGNPIKLYQAVLATFLGSAGSVRWVSSLERRPVNGCRLTAVTRTSHCMKTAVMMQFWPGRLYTACPSTGYCDTRDLSSAYAAQHHRWSLLPLQCHNYHSLLPQYLSSTLLFSKQKGASSTYV